MRKIDWKPIGNFVGQAGEIVLYGLALATSWKIGEYITGFDRKTAGYSDAVKAIMDSRMFSHDKRDAVELLERYESSEYYKAVIQVAKDSSMFSHDKVKMIKHLSES
jgi:hypothetical protein